MTTECPKCECNDVEKAGQGVRWGKPWQKWRCNYCGHTWSAAPPTRPEAEAGLRTVDYHVMHCPFCGSEKTKVEKTLRPFRYHVCHGCKKTFKSSETTTQTP